MLHTDQYWVTFPERSRDDLARTLTLVRGHPPAGPLPHISGLEGTVRRRQEEDNVKQCLAYARDKLELQWRALHRRPRVG
ncbi:MAG TPA: hypothetical protein VKM93_18415 [Terriglobia bacterium]|nr:hypothetical protein [Terriglobia bacterium]